jgi:hypothetical protein
MQCAAGGLGNHLTRAGVDVRLDQFRAAAAEWEFAASWLTGFG